jgi:L-alanine-DL-glutamate epimerase-like enolase superfamily enzyme
MNELHGVADFNTTIKSAFDMALYDLGAKASGKPLYAFLGGKKKHLETDLTIGIDAPARMAETAIAYRDNGVRIIKIKLGKDWQEDVKRVQLIREAAGPEIILRIDANQGWTYASAVAALTAMEEYDIQFCEQPMRTWNDDQLPALKKASPIPLMADESVYDHHDALRLIREDACSYLNIKLSKSGGMLEAEKIHAAAASHNMRCMMGGMLESRLALTACAHFASAFNHIVYYDLDTCLLGHKADPVIGGIQFDGCMITLPDAPGNGADADERFLEGCEKVVV